MSDLVLATPTMAFSTATDSYVVGVEALMPVAYVELGFAVASEKQQVEKPVDKPSVKVDTVSKPVGLDIKSD